MLRNYSFLKTDLFTKNAGARVLRKIFESKWEEVQGGQRKQHYEKSRFVLIFIIHYGDQIKKGETGGICGTHGTDEKHTEYW